MFTASNGSRSRAQRNLHERIAHEIGVRIVRGDFAESDVLPTELALAEQFRVSRTAVREAFRILSAKGMTHSRPKIGTRVRSRTYWNLLDSEVLGWHRDGGLDKSFLDCMFEVRRIVEPEAAANAAERRSDQQLKAMAAALSVLQRSQSYNETSATAAISFVLAILDASGNPLFRSLATVTEFTIRFELEHVVSEPTLSAAAQEALKAQSSAFSAIRDQNPGEARRAVGALVELNRQLLSGRGQPAALA